MVEIDYHEIGEEFEYNGRKYKVVDTCGECDLNDLCAGADRMNCVHEKRADMSDVIYKDVNKREVTLGSLLSALSVVLIALFAVCIIQVFLQGFYLIGSLLIISLLYIVLDSYLERKKK